MNRDGSHDPGQEPSHRTSAEPARSEQRVSTLVGDRLCIKCGYNLIGQQVVREPHYSILIVRCPECGTVASLQEYPLLGRWANRWAVLLAAIWFLVMLLLVLGGGAAIFGFSNGTAFASASIYSQFLATKYQEHQQNLAKAAGTATPLYSIQEMTAWRDAQDFDRLFQQAGGWKHAVDWYALTIWVPGAICTFAIGCFASIALMTHRRRSRWCAAFLILASAAMYSYLFGYLLWQHQQSFWFWNEPMLRIGSRMLLLSLAVGSLALILGMLIGRKLVRGLMRILLPPRLLQSLAILWIVDGLQPPRIPTN